MKTALQAYAALCRLGARGIAASLAMAVFACFAVPCFAQTAPDATSSAKPPSVLDAVNRGKALLQAELDRRTAAGEEGHTVSSEPSVANEMLAVWDRGTNEVTTIIAAKSGRHIVVKTAGDWPIRVDRSAKIASLYSFPAKRNAMVVGVLYPVATKIAVSKKKTVYRIDDAVYVPFTNAFFVPEVLSAGSDYLSYLVQGAFDELRQRQVMSRAYPDKLVVDVIDPYLLKSIVVIEHTDPASLLTQDDPEHSLGVFLAKLGLNGENAFDGTQSNAGAMGLAQFIPSTYKLFVKNRPDLALIPDFTTGMNDHQNAVKAEIAYLDESLAELPSAVRETYANDRMKAATYLAAAYNGGSVRVRKAMAAYGEDWADPYGGQLASWQAAYDKLIDRGEAVKAEMRKTSDKKKYAALANELYDIRRTYRPIAAKIAVAKSSGLKRETVLYVAKLKKTYAMFTSGVFATPAAPSGALPQVVAATAADTPVQLAQATADTICFGDGSCVQGK